MANVDGLKVLITGAELATMSHDSAKYHTGRAEELTRRAEELRALAMTDRDRAELVRRTTGYASTERRDPAEELAESAASHRRRAHLHTFLSSHFDPDARYALTLNELRLYGYRQE